MELMYLVTNVDPMGDNNCVPMLTETKVFEKRSVAEDDVKKRIEYYESQGYKVEDNRVYLDYDEEDDSSESWFDIVIKEVPVVR